MPELELDVDLNAVLGSISSRLDREERQRQRMASAIRQGPLIAPQMVLSGNAGVIDMPDLLACKTGYNWGVRRITLSGFSAGTAIVYLNSTSGEPVAPFAQAGTFTFGKGQLLMQPGDRLIVTATGITGLVQLNGAVDIFEQWYLPYYLG